MKSCRTLQFLVRQHFLPYKKFIQKNKMLYEIHFTGNGESDFAVVLWISISQR